MHPDAETVVIRQDFFDDGASKTEIIVSTRLKLDASDPEFDEDRLNALKDYVRSLVAQTPGAAEGFIQESVEDQGV